MQWNVSETQHQPAEFSHGDRQPLLPPAIRLWNDAELALAAGLAGLLFLLPTIIWLVMTMLRRRR
jgi:hypothetical protein